ncbi:MAG: DUF4012 domain-containing protein [Candidatus Levybacteria bacterium]|nr:DUF4012 domain-containing protein [Candidatus Levybacteria bacterium]MBP9815130.1 DUF4012 domain-containing protein [Candidatus Levybacteria bacterium]
MPHHLIVEEIQKNPPPILLIDTNSGIKNTLLNLLVKKIGDKGKIYVLTSKKVEGVYEKISPLGTYFFDHLSDNLNHSVVFLDDISQKKKVLEIIFKLESRQTRVVVIIPYRVVEQFVDVMLSLRDKKNVIIALIGDIYGYNNQSTPLSQLISSALIDKKITMSGDDLMKIFPISEVDAVSSIEYLLFGVRSPVFIYNIFYKSPQTLTSFIHILKRQEPELAVTYGRNNDNKALLAKQDRTHFIKERLAVAPHYVQYGIGFEKSIEQMIDTKKQQTTKGKMKRYKEKKYYLKNILKVLKLLLIGFLVYVFLMVILFLTSIFTFKLGLQQVSKGNFSQSSKYLFASRVLYELSNKSISVFIVFPSELTQGKIREQVTVFGDMVKISNEIILVISEFEKKDTTITQDKLKNVFTTFTQLYFLLERSDIPEYGKSAILSMLSSSSSVLPLLPVMSSSLGFEGEKTYLILFQNNTELRPTGGFVGSVGKLTLIDGKIKELRIQDVYDLDGQLKGHVEPHYIIRRYLQPHLYLRDSNFSPDFSASASMSALLYSLEGGGEVDGVIAVDTAILIKALEITGPITMPSGDTITSKNVVDLLDKTIHDDFFPGSSTKKDTLNTLLNKIMIVFENDKQKTVKLINALLPLLSEKHILFSFINNSTQKAFVAAGLAGSMSDARGENYGVSDFLSINEANIGVNKANKHIERKVLYSAYIEPGILNSDVLVEYQNKGDQAYKTYIRFIVPQDTQEVSIFIDGVKQEIVPAVTSPAQYERLGFKPPVGLEVDQEIDANNHKVFGFIATVTAHTTSRIRVLYGNNKIVPKTGKILYSFLYVKQPGTDKYPLTVQLQSDPKLTVSNKESRDVILFNDYILGDKEFTRELVQIKD